MSDEGHVFDPSLASGLSCVFRGATVADFGCGKGDYVRFLRQQDILADGYDGNPHTPIMSNGTCTVLDLSYPVNLRPYTWVLSLEVGEHIPAAYEQTFLMNMHTHALEGVVISWAIPGQPGRGHVNLHENAYIKQWFASMGYLNDGATEEFLRSVTACYWLKETIMVFRRRSSPISLACHSIGASGGGIDSTPLP
jgi:cyclopropane fatty-acyl-phospholipid synthase-like methyltransferase